MELDQEFEEFFQHLDKITNCNEKDIKNILKPLKHLFWKQQLAKYIKITLLVISICYAVYYIDTLNWYFCAFGRIILIKMLPLWDWTYLAKSKCLISKSTQQRSSYANDEFNLKDCRSCEHFEKIDVMKETTYNHIHDKFLIRGLPVIVTDTIKNLNTSESLLSFINNISTNMSDMISSEACNFETNLMMSKYAKLDETFAILKKSLEEEEKMMPWFISFRNCKTKSLKSSRLMMSKPYFYPINLQAPYTTWVLISQNYKNYENDLEVYGLIIVTQMKGCIKITLRVNERCQTFCQDLSVNLFPGESLVFFSGLWTLSYEFIEDESFSATYITETHLY